MHGDQGTDLRIIWDKNTPGYNVDYSNYLWLINDPYNSNSGGVESASTGIKRIYT